MGYPEIHSFSPWHIYFCCEHSFNSLIPILEADHFISLTSYKNVKKYFLKFGFEYLIIFSYCANICLRKVVDSKILCLFTFVFKACNVCNFSKKNDRFTLCGFFYQHNFIFHDLPKTNVRYFSIHWPF